MLTINNKKFEYLKKLSTEDGVIEALAIDQRGALRKMISALSEEPQDKQISEFKSLVSEELTPYASSILLDPEYGLDAAERKAKSSGLLLAYEQTGYDVSTSSRLPDLLPGWSVKRLKEMGADGIKFLLYYDVDQPDEINNQKKAFVERVGSECLAENLPFFLELVTYDEHISDATSAEYAAIKPSKVIPMMEEFSKPQYEVTVLKVEVPVNMNYVEGFGDEVVHTKEQAKGFFKDQSDATSLPFIFLSAGVSNQLFKDTLLFAHEAHSKFNGVLCGRATWRNGVAPFIKEGEDSAIKWLNGEGKANIQGLNEVVDRCASSWLDKVAVSE